MTFNERTSRLLMDAVAEEVDAIEKRGVDVHTVVLELNGQHGEFDVWIRGTNSDMEECETAALGWRSGGLTNVHTTTGVEPWSPGMWR